jgi:hypothetical protein
MKEMRPYTLIEPETASEPGHNTKNFYSHLDSDKRHKNERFIE